MANFTLGVVLETLGLPVKATVERAAQLGARCVQFDVAGDLRPEVLSETGKRELRVLFRTHNLSLAALQLPLRHGLDAAEHQQQRIDHVKKAMAFAVDLGANILSVPLPKLAKNDKATATLRDSILALAPHGDRMGVRLALEAGLDPGDAVRDYLAQYDFGLGVTFDPANFLANGHDPVAAFSSFASLAVHMQARDVRRGSLSGGAKETAVGAGDVEWLPLMATLDALDYRGAIVVDREEGPQRGSDVASGLQFLKRFSTIAM